MNNKIKSLRGFTLLEVMIATFIVAVGLVGVSNLIVQNIQVQYINKNAIISSQLAQEGLELVRNIRDNNWLDSTVDPTVGWKHGQGAGTNSDIVQDGSYTIDYWGDINSSVDNIDEAKLYINENSGGYYYNHDSGGEETPFKRLILVTEGADDNFVEVTCQVRASERNRQFDYVAETVLYNWR